MSPSPEQIGRAVRALLQCQPAHPLLTARFLARMELFATHLALWGARTNLTAQPTDPNEISFHILDSLTPLSLPACANQLDHRFEPDRAVVDFGSGAGFPALVLAAATEARFTLIEARHKRSSFLTIASDSMGLANIEILTQRAIPSLQTPVFDLALARAFGPPAEVFMLAAQALKPDGLLILYATPSQPLDQRAADAAGFRDHHSHPYRLKRAAREVDHRLDIWRRAANST